MVGAELVFALSKEVKAFEKTGQLKLLLNARVTRLIRAQLL